MSINQKYFFAITLMAASFISSGVPAFAQTPSTANPPVISGVAADNITQSSVVISWNTDVPATTRLDYGSTISYEINSIFDSGLRTFHQIQVSPLDTNTLYHYRPRSTDASGRERVEADRTFTTKPPLDYMPPEEITSLRVASATVTSLVLTWIAPGGDGQTGTSTSYEIRTSYTTIPEIGALQWWNNADILQSSLPAKSRGSQESYTMKNLATSTKYYVAVRSRDQAGNISPLSISDIRSGTTLAASAITVVSVSALSSPVATSTITTTVAATSTATSSALSQSGGVSAGVLNTPATPVSKPGIQPTALSVQSTPATLFTGNLSYGMRNESVKTLQRILIAKGLLKQGNDSGFFGSLTLAAVKKFQCSQKIICSGSARTTGYGFVGPKTRAKLGGVQ